MIEVKESIVGEMLRKFDEYLEGKKVLLVGGTNLEDISQTALLNFDVYVTINHHAEKVDWLTPDVIFSSENVCLDKYEGVAEDEIPSFLFWDLELAMNLEFGLSKHPILVPYSCIFFKERRSFGLSSDWNHSLIRMMNTRPLTGMIALDRILATRCESVHMIGFDFYSDDGIRIPYSYNSHNIENNFEWFLEKHYSDERVSVDEKLQTLIDAHKTINPPEFIRVERDEMGRCWRK